MEARTAGNHCRRQPEGCRTGENFNFGLVNNHDEPWEILMTRMAEVNSRVEALHVALSKP